MYLCATHAPLVLLGGCQYLLHTLHLVVVPSRRDFLVDAGADADISLIMSVNGV